MKKTLSSKKILVLFLCIMLTIVGCVSINNSSEDDSSIYVGKWNVNLNFGQMEKHTIDETKSYEITGIKNININTVSTSVEFFPIDQNEIKAHFHGIVETSSNVLPALEVVQEGNEITVNINRKNSVSVGTHRESLRLDIYLPSGEYEKLTVKTVSGKINIDEVNLDEFRIETVSGSINVESTQTKTTFVKAVSGKINLLDFNGDLDAGTVSGAINIEYAQFQNNIELKTTSGKINLKLPEDAKFGLWAKTTSGRLDCSFPIKLTKNDKRTMEGIVETDENQINIKTVSGGINIYY